MSRADGHEIVVAVRTITTSAAGVAQEELLDALKAIGRRINEPSRTGSQAELILAGAILWDVFV